MHKFWNKSKRLKDAWKSEDATDKDARIVKINLLTEEVIEILLNTEN